MKSGNPRQAALSLLTLAMALTAPTARAEAVQDTLLSLFYGGKLGLSVLAAGTAFTEPDMSAHERLVVAGSAVLVGTPSALVLAYARHRRPAALRRWRMTAFAIDAALSALAIGKGLSIWADGDSSLSDDYAGLAFVLLGTTGAIVSAADLVAFDVEGR
jgi:ABC-type Fe3+ transport system permease subunit